MALCSSAYSVPEACHRASAAFAKLCTAAQDALINAPSARPRAAGTPEPRYRASDSFGGHRRGQLH